MQPPNVLPLSSSATQSEASFQEQLDLYKKAGMPKKQILQRIEHDFGHEYRLMAENQLLDANKPTGPGKVGVLFIMALMAVFSILLGYFLFTSVLESQSFSSSKCPGVFAITINGDAEFMQKIRGALLLIESKNCSYLRFVGASSHDLYSSSSLAPGGSIYDPLQHSMAPDYSGSDYFVADAIIHQACHSYQRLHNQPQDEHNCALTQLDFLTSIGAPASDIDKIAALKTNPDYYFDSNNTDVYGEWLINQ